MHYMTSPLSIRFETQLLERLRRRAAATPGATVSGLAARLVEEGLRMAEHPGIVFKDGPAGRRAAVASGPDVREIVTVVREIDERGDAALEAATELLALSGAQLRLALAYYAAHRQEIDWEIDAAESDSRAAEAAWQTQQQLLA